MGIRFKNDFMKVVCYWMSLNWFEEFDNFNDDY